MGISDLYIKEFRRNIKNYFPNWKPNELRELGDFGILQKDVFSKIGNIKDMGISFNTIVQDVDGCESIGSNAMITSSSTIQGGAQSTARAEIEISLKKGSSIFLNSVYKKSYEIKSLYELEQQILNKLRSNEWDKKYVVITNIAKSYNTIIVISEGSDSKVILGCEAQDLTDLNRAELGFTLKRKTEGTFSYYTQNESFVIPMFRLAQLQGILNYDLVPLRGSGSFNEEDLEYQLKELE